MTKKPRKNNPLAPQSKDAMSIRLSVQRLLSGKKAPPMAERMPKPPQLKPATIADLRAIGRPWPPEQTIEEKPEIKKRGRALGLALVFIGLLVIAFAFLLSVGYSPSRGILGSLPYMRIDLGSRMETRWLLFAGIALCLLGAYARFIGSKRSAD